MKKKTVYYSPPRYPKRRRGGCACDQNYVKSLQGICKIFSLVLSFIAIIVIGTTPYYRTLFVLEGVTWPFHVAMLFTVVLFITTLGVFVFFLTGQHLEYPQVAWPTVELIFNLISLFAVLFAAILEISNVWRWDYNRGFYQSNNGFNNGFNRLSIYGYGAGMPFSNRLDMGSYCRRYPNDCRDYFALLSGNSSYYGNHIFASILLFILIICYLVSSIFAFRTWRVFKREMTNGVVKTEPSTWERFRFQMSEVKFPTGLVANVRGRFGKLLNRNRDDENEGKDDVEIDSSRADDDQIFVDLKEKKYISSSVKSSADYISSRSHHSSSHHESSHHGSYHHDDSHRIDPYKQDSRSDRPSHSSSQSKQHRRDNGRSRSPLSDKSSRSHKSRERPSSSGKKSRKSEEEDIKIDAKNLSSVPVDSGPVASVMC